jgi:branched-chain amino acid transport system substrate-binding protein
VFEEGVDPGIRDMLPVLTKAMAANPDVLVLHLHSGPTALFVRQAAASAAGIPIIAGSAMHQPSTAALLEPTELKGVCAETSASPISGGTPELEKFTADYRTSFNTDPDAFSLGQYDGIAMVLDAAAKGATTPEDIRDVLSQSTYKGLAMTYRSDGKGNMAHSASIVCYDGASRVPAITKRYEAVAGQ